MVCFVLGPEGEKKLQYVSQEVWSKLLSDLSLLFWLVVVRYCESITNEVASSLWFNINATSSASRLNIAWTSGD